MENFLLRIKNLENWDVFIVYGVIFMNNTNKQNSHKQNGSKKIDSNSKKDNKSTSQFHCKKEGKTTYVSILIIISPIFSASL